MKLSCLSDPPALQGKRIAVLVSSWWYDTITSKLQAAATQYLSEQGVTHVHVQQVPGCFELPLTAQVFATRKDIDAIIALGCILQGETPHFTYICRACCDGLMHVSLQHTKPVGFGVITAETREQAQARSANDDRNKGTEAAAAVVHMLHMMEKKKVYARTK